MDRCKNSGRNRASHKKSEPLQNMLRIQMKRSTAFPILRATTLLLSLLLVFTGFVKVFRIREENGGIFHFDKFYELQPNTVDALFVGSSHMYRTFNPAILYNEYGIAAYNLPGNQQPMWNSYYYIKEALKTQSPQIIVLEGYGLRFNYEYNAYTGEIIYNNYGLRASSDKINSLIASVPGNEFFEYIFEFNRYHSRYNSLARGDFIPNLDSKLLEHYKGYYLQQNKQEFEVPLIIEEGSPTIELSYKTEMYYRKIIELCQGENIPLEIVISPYVITAQDQMQINRGMEVAQEYNVPFLNYNLYYDELQFDFMQDMGDNAHTNYRGSEKVTKHYGRYLLGQYNLPDRRQLQEWVSWEQYAKMHYQRVQNIEIKQIKQMDGFSDAVAQQPDYTVIVTVTGDCRSFYQQAIDVLASFGIHDVTYDLKGTWVIQNREIIAEFLPGSNGKPYLQLGKFRFDFSIDGAIIANTKNCNTLEDGINILVYDSFTDTVVDSVGINHDGFCRR